MELVAVVGKIPLPDENGEMPEKDKENNFRGMEYAHRYHARFSTDEKKELYRILKNYDSEKVDRFVSLLAAICADYWVFLKQRRNAEIKQIIEGFIPALKDAVKTLERINKQKWPLIEQMKSVQGFQSDKDEKRQHVADLNSLCRGYSAFQPFRLSFNGHINLRYIIL